MRKVIEAGVRKDQTGSQVSSEDGYSHGSATSQPSSLSKPLHLFVLLFSRISGSLIVPTTYGRSLSHTLDRNCLLEILLEKNHLLCK